MQIALRQIKEVVNNQVQILLPDYFDTKQVEIIIIPVYSEDSQKPCIGLKVNFNKYFGISSLENKLIDEYLKNIRNDWDRKISD